MSNPIFTSANAVPFVVLLEHYNLKHKPAPQTDAIRVETCPFCGKKDFTATIYNDKNTYNCWKCKMHCGTVDFVLHMNEWPKGKRSLDAAQEVMDIYLASQEAQRPIPAPPPIDKVACDKFLTILIKLKKANVANYNYIMERLKGQ